MRYIGLDVHYHSSTYCILEENGREVQCETIRGHWPKLLDRLRGVEGPWTICFEATCGYGYLHRELSRMATRVVVAHPGQLRLIFRSKRKNDRVDARKLAKLLYLDEVPEAYVPGQDVQSWRELIEHRRRMVDRQTTCKNAIRSLLRSHGKIVSKGLWTKKGLAQPASISWRRPGKGCIAPRRSGRTSSGSFTAATSDARSRWWRPPTTCCVACTPSSSAVSRGMRRRENEEGDRLRGEAGAGP